ncbi:4-hydroxythreonine-4-phosphate dehydrogenase PdxA [soil metagenome]
MIAITAGEPAGIGPEIVVAALAERFESRASSAADVAIIGDRRRLFEAAEEFGLASALDAVQIIDMGCAVPVVAGQLDVRNAPAVLRMLDIAIDGAIAKRFSAIVTAPVHKGIVADSGVAFTGHTEYLAERCQVDRVVMMLAGVAHERPLRVALATTHLALREVPDAIDITSLVATIGIIDAELRERFGIAEPRIAVCGLNPHAGEGGHLGREEIDVIAPAIAAARARGAHCEGPMPADTVFNPRSLAAFDVVLAMYHDQGLPVLKHATFGEGINVTLGLPIIRTSVDHGTALDLAGTGRGDHGSLVAAWSLAEQLAQTIGRSPSSR